MAENEVEKFEHEAEDALKSIGGEVPVSEAKILSPKVLEILVKHAGEQDAAYTSKKGEYIVNLGFVEMKMPGQKLGFYEDIPDDFEVKDAETVSFVVKGFHQSEETEVQFSEGRILLNRNRKHGHIVDFQRAVLMKEHS